MAQERSKPRYTRHNAEEDRAWFHLYRDAGKPSAAREVVQILDADPDERRAHYALYMICRQTLREQKAREARNQRIAAFVGMMLAAVFVSPWRALRTLATRSGEIALELLPETRQEPAVQQLRRVRKSKTFAQASSDYREPAMSEPAGSAEQAPPSRSAKAA